MAHRTAQGKDQTEAFFGEHVGIIKRPATAHFALVNMPPKVESLAHLLEQRENLIRLAAAQRTTLAQSVELWRIPLARVDQGLLALRAIKRNPAWIVAGMVLLTVLRPSRLVKWLRGGWVAWHMLHGLRRK